MKHLFKRFSLFRVAALLLVLAVPALSGCEDDTDDGTQTAAALLEESKAEDDALIQGYLTRRGITEGTGVNKYRRLSGETNNGIYIVDLADGPSTGANIVKGNSVDVRYVGRYVGGSNIGGVASTNKEDDIFDNSTENGIPCGCINVLRVGAGVIPGWSEGLLFMKKGDRKLLLIPSYLAYGSGIGSNGTRIFAPYEPLVFEMTILDVK
ncbi:FKBP-type peptidyl-prolyl cis-trans isomerase [Hymenobacter tibetensis]|uniref:Peptidyl-prolyl cis-trans isomerase n=1 Tax=Hymenobacter tibetensis TaxID=497967 RepID=A0ABY4CZ91_9BACT|nr:FKBP-type peptidyl-prolyl cis-trans isomerase [Hymenobacter tibetensis]UOG75590.1 FKBP-type peptidyl-prolyl cis-trans isomerase [Hymenobacter tibetensis]